MNTHIRYVAEPTHVREVSLQGTANLAYWTTRLSEENLQPVERGGRAQLLIVAAEMSFLGIRFTEVSFSVLVLVPGYQCRDAAFLVHAFTSSRLFAFCERRLFATPYTHAECQVSVADCASIRINLTAHAAFRAEMPPDFPASIRKPTRSGEQGWEGLIFLPGSRLGRGDAARLFYGRIKGFTQAYRFAPEADIVSIRPSHSAEILQALLESEFAAEEWAVRADATHGKSKTYRRSEMRCS